MKPKTMKTGLVACLVAVLCCVPVTSASALTVTDDANDVFRFDGTIVGSHSYIDLRDAVWYNTTCELAIRCYGDFNSHPLNYGVALIAFIETCDPTANDTILIAAEYHGEGFFYLFRGNVTMTDVSTFEDFFDIEEMNLTAAVELDPEISADGRTVTIGGNCSWFPALICNITVFSMSGPWDGEPTDLVFDVMPNSLITQFGEQIFGLDFNYNESVMARAAQYHTLVIVIYVITFCGLLLKGRAKPKVR